MVCTESATELLELLEAIQNIVVNHDAKSGTPAQNMIAVGEAIAKVGTILQDIPVQEGRRVLRAVAILNGLELPPNL